jgi:hypothetical protein
MKLNKTMVWAAAALLATMLSGKPAFADSIPVLSVTGTTPGPVLAEISSGLVDDPEFSGISFELGQSLNNVSISSPSFMAAGEFTGTAWLTNAIGPSATAANVVASAPVDVCTTGGCGVPGGFESVQFLSGLNLAPGTYYFLISTPLALTGSGADFARFNSYSDATVSTAQGVTANGEFSASCGLSNGGVCGDMNQSFAPASNFTSVSANTSSFLITASAPEPSSIALVLVPLLLLFLLRAQTCLTCR